VAEADEVEVSGDSASKGQMSVLDALKGVLKLALMHDGLARGLREASKALDRRQAHMCVLNVSAISCFISSLYMSWELLARQCFNSQF
jgi:small subunit ribosomal protein S12e